LKPVSQTEVIKLGPEVAEKLKSFGGDSSGNPAQIGNDQGTSLPDEGWLFPWIPKARELGEEVFSKHPKYSVLQIAEKVNVEMTRLSETEEKAKVIGRGGRVPSAGTIKRHALTGLTKPK
jgi:hypothetical protein